MSVVNAWLTMVRPGHYALVAMPPPDPSPSPQVAALRAAAESICAQLHLEVRGQQRVIRGSAVGELTEADVERIARHIADDARARLDAAVHGQLPESPEMLATRREAAYLVATAARLAGDDLRQAWRARQAPRRWWRPNSGDGGAARTSQ